MTRTIGRLALVLKQPGRPGGAGRRAAADAVDAELAGGADARRGDHPAVPRFGGARRHLLDGSRDRRR